jgi:hypothetical protein
MKTKHFFLTAGLLTIFAFNGFSQWFWNYSTAPVSASSVGGVAISSSKVQFTNATGNAFRRYYYPLITPALTTYWRLDFDFSYLQNTGPNGMAHFLAALTAGSQDMTCSSLAPPYPATNQDLIGVKIETPSSSSQASASLTIVAKRTTLQSVSSGIAVFYGANYYVTLERYASSGLKLSVYSDPNRTLHVAGSPICFTAFDATTGVSTPLTYMQHGVVAWAGVDRTMTGSVDNVRLDNITTPCITPSQTLCVLGEIPAPLTSCTNTPFFNCTYQWQISTSSLPFNWVNIPGATSQNYNPPFTNVTSYYRRLSFNFYGCSSPFSAQSNTVTITVPTFSGTIDCNISDAYSSTVTPVWTQTNSDVTVNYTALGKCEFKNTASDIERRVTRNIGLLPATKWRIDFDFRYDPLSNPGHLITSVTKNNSAPWPSVSTQDMIFVGFGQINMGGGSSLANTSIWAGSKNGTAPGSTTGTGIPILSNITYYLSLERFNCSTTAWGRITVFSDAARTIIVGTPQLFGINPVINSLSYIQHGNKPDGTAFRLTGQIDNLCIDTDYQFGGHRIGNSSQLIEEGVISNNNILDFTVYPNPSVGIFTISTDVLNDGTIEIYDSRGKKVEIIKLNNEISDYTINLTNHAKGIYIVNLLSNGKIQSKKIILE